MAPYLFLLPPKQLHFSKVQSPALLFTFPSPHIHPPTNFSFSHFASADTSHLPPSAPLSPRLTMSGWLLVVLLATTPQPPKRAVYTLLSALSFHILTTPLFL